MTTTTTPDRTAAREHAIRTLALAFLANGSSAGFATEQILAVMDTSSRTVNRWATDIIADAYCTCAATFLGHRLHTEGCAAAALNA